MWLMIKKIIQTGCPTETAPAISTDNDMAQEKVQAELFAILGRALCIRQVDAGSCNACELEIHALGNPYYNIEGLGIKFVASPRHADMLLVTGPVTKNMEAALKLAYDAVPDPKLVVAVGECACDGGMFGQTYASCGGVASVIPVNLSIKGCPPPPIEILKGILSAVKTAARVTNKSA